MRLRRSGSRPLASAVRVRVRGLHVHNMSIDKLCMVHARFSDKRTVHEGLPQLPVLGAPALRLGQGGRQGEGREGGGVLQLWW